jgi:hypothetical protein
MNSLTYRLSSEMTCEPLVAVHHHVLPCVDMVAVRLHSRQSSSIKGVCMVEMKMLPS